MGFQQKDLFSYHYTRTENPDKSVFEQHCHDSYELLYVLRGEGRYFVEGIECPLHANTAILFHPYEFHYVCPDERSPYERVVINFSLRFLDESLRELPLLIPERSPKRERYFSSETIGSGVGDVLCAAESFAKSGCLSDDGEADATIIRSVLQTALLLLSSAEAELRPDQNNETRISQIIAYLNSHLDERITLDELAGRFYINKYYLCRIFREETGMTVFAYLQTKRIALAERLMRSGFSAGEAAERSGFPEYSTFWRAYRRQNGRSPANRRRDAGGEQND